MSLTRAERSELLDDLTGEIPHDELVDNLRDIRRANRYFGGTRAVVAALRPFVEHPSITAETPLTVLDLATGSADIPLALARIARQRGWSLRVTATDAQPEILAVAAQVARDTAVMVERADARELAYASDQFDVVLLSLALHHFAPDVAVQVLGEMRRVAGRTMIVNDLERSRMGFVGAWVFSRVMTRNRLTRHDAPLSVQRAYTSTEALVLARAAGWRHPQVRRVLPFRYVLTGSP